MIDKEIKKLALKKLENIDLNLQQKQTLLDVMSMVSKDVSIGVADWSIKNDYYKRINEENGVDYTKCVEIRNLTDEYNTITIKNTNGAVISSIAKNVYGNSSEIQNNILYGNNDIVTYIIPPKGIVYMEFVMLYGLMNKTPRVLFEKDVALKGKIIANGRTDFDYLFSGIEVDENGNVNLNNIPVNNIVDCSELNIEVSSAKYMFAGNINLTETPNIVFNSNDNVDLTGMFYGCKALNKVYINKDISTYDATKQHDYILDKMLYETKGGDIYNFTKTVQGQTGFLRDNSSKPNDYHYLTITDTYNITNVKWNIHNEFYLAECKAQITNNIYDDSIWNIRYETNYNTEVYSIYTPYISVILQTIDCPNDRARWVLVNPVEAGQKMKYITNLFPENKIVYYKHVYIKNCNNIIDVVKKTNSVIINGLNQNIVNDINDVDFIPYYNSRSNENFQLTLYNDSINNVSVRLIGDLATFNGHETGYICTNYFNKINNSPVSILSINVGINAEVNIDEVILLYSNCSFINSSIHGIKDGLTIKGKDLRKSSLRFRNSNGVINYDIDKITGGNFQTAFDNSSISTFPDFSTITKVDNYDAFTNTFYDNKNITFIDLSNITSIYNDNGIFYCRFVAMFQNASNLQEVIVPNIKEWNTDAFYNWLKNAGSAVTGNKIIRKPVGLDIPSGDSGIPDGWIIEEYCKEAVYIKNETNNNIRFINDYYNIDKLNLEYSLDNDIYQSYDVNTPDINIPAGKCIYFRGINTDVIFNVDTHFVFNCNDKFSTGGDIRTLLNYQDINSVTKIPDHCFASCFIYNENLTSCTWDMSGITEVGDEGFYNCFYICTSLITAPDFSNVTSIGDYGFENCFSGCSSLTTAPDFSNVTSIGDYGFGCCFYNCKPLTKVTTPNITEWDTTKFDDWLSGCFSGTLYKPANLTIPSGDSGVPEGWTVKNYGE